MTTMERDLPQSGACAFYKETCITCSDAGIPARVVSVKGDDALCEDAAGGRAEIAIELVAPVSPGEVLLTHGGVAIGRVSEQTADEPEC